MSAQVIDALRKRADALEKGARDIGAQKAAGNEITSHDPRDEYGPYSGVHVAIMLFTAREFRKLADESEGREPGGGHG
jgi:hypothetical protein